jgi:hypothetical protein
MRLLEKESSASRNPGRANMLLSAFVLAGGLAGCHSKTDHSAVETEKQKAVLRIDQFQAAASNRKVAVVVGHGVAVVSDLRNQQMARIALQGTPALIDVASCADGSFVALDFNRKVWLADSDAKIWKAQPIKGNWRPLALTCDAQNRIWVVGSGTTIASSSDKGASWQEQNFNQDAMFNTVQFVDPDNGFITGEFGAVYSTSDSGASWKAEAKIPNDFYPYAALFTSTTEGYVTGLAGAMLQTKNGGKSWGKLDNPSGLPQFGLTHQGNTIYSVGVGGSLQRLENQRWQPVNYGKSAPAYLRAATAVGTDRLLIAGGAGALQMIPATANAAAQPISK